MYKTLNQHYRERFGCKVYKLSIDAGFTCPNRDGTVGTGGCTFCSASGGGDFAERSGGIRQQLEQAKMRVSAKMRSGKYIAYFQSFTNTYGPVARLEALYREAMEPEDIVGLAIGTRPDCLGPDVIALLERLNRIKPITVELGLQTIHDATAETIHRGYPAAVYLDAVKRLKAAKLEVVTHIILGLPGETEEMMVESARAAVAAGTDGVKFHLLHILRGTQMAQDYLEGRIQCLSLPQYARILKQCLDILPAHIVVHRITGDGAKKDLVAPLWSADKKHVLNYLNRYLSSD